MDGKTAKVSTWSGSTVVTIGFAELEKLSEGVHAVTVRFDDGEAELTFTVRAARGTSDTPPDR